MLTLPTPMSVPNELFIQPDTGVLVPFAEVTQPGGGGSEVSFGTAGAPNSVARTFRCYFGERYNFMKDVLGWTERHDVSPGIVNLRRYLPMRDPEFPWLLATRVSRCVPVGKPGGKVIAEHGPYADYPFAHVTVLFEQVEYDVLDDGQLDNLFGGNEARRFTSWNWTYAGDMISKEGGTFEYAEAPPGGAIHDKFLKPISQFLGRFDLVLTWHGVPEIAVCDITSKILNPNITTGVGRVNSAEWPKPVSEGGLEKGSLLLKSVQTILKSIPVDPEELPGLNVWNPPRTVDVQFLMSYFSPKSANNVYFGWNLVPGPDLLWYLATHDGTTTGNTLYGYYDFNDLFKVA